MKRIFLSAILFCVAVIMIISGVSLQLFNNYQEDKEMTLAYVNSTKEYYDNIKNNLENAYSYMNSMNDFFSLYYEEAMNVREKYDLVMKEIAGIKVNIDFDYQNMNFICEKEMNNMDLVECKEIDTSYSNFSNTYNSLLENYHSFLEQCNKWGNNI